MFTDVDNADGSRMADEEQDDDDRDVVSGTDNGSDNVAIAQPTQVKPLKFSAMAKLFLFSFSLCQCMYFFSFPSFFPFCLVFFFSRFCLS